MVLQVIHRQRAGTRLRTSKISFEKINQAIKLVMLLAEASGIWSNPSCRALNAEVTIHSPRTRVSTVPYVIPITLTKLLSLIIFVYFMTSTRTGVNVKKKNITAQTALNIVKFPNLTSASKPIIGAPTAKARKK